MAVNTYMNINAANVNGGGGGASQAQVDALITLSGVASLSTDLGTFTGSIIPDNSTIKAALQSLETAELWQVSSGIISPLTAGNSLSIAAVAHDISLSAKDATGAATVISTFQAEGSTTDKQAKLVGTVASDVANLSLISKKTGVTHQIDMSTAANVGIVQTSGVADGVSNSAHTFNTSNTIAAIGCNLITVKNNGNERFAVKNYGDGYFFDTLTVNSGGSSNGSGILVIGNQTNATQGMRFRTDKSTAGTAIIDNDAQARIDLISTGTTGAEVKVNPQIDVGVSLTVFGVYNNSGAEELFEIYGDGDIFHEEGGRSDSYQGTAVSAEIVSKTITGVTDTSAPRTITIDQEEEYVGRVLVIKDESGAAGTNAITIDTETASKIDGQDSIQITANYGVARLYFNGTHWFTC